MPYREEWPREYRAVIQLLRPTFPKSTIFHHIGSTAVIGLAAKNIIDIQATVVSLKERLASWFPDDADRYYEVKDPLFDLMMDGAEAWARLVEWSVPDGDLLGIASLAAPRAARMTADRETKTCLGGGSFHISI